MSFLDSAVASIESLAGTLLSGVLFIQRNIGGFIPNVTVEEQATDELMITQHPVEQGAAITDHAYKMPAQVTIYCGFSNSSIGALGNQFYVQEVYQGFLALQASRVPFIIVTGKRTYQNMLIKRLSQTTDAKYENALMLRVECQEILLAQTQTVSAANPADMATPQLNQSTQNQGTLSLQPAPNFNATAASGIGIGAA